jgi:tetratricopeptide (TPR) repeat protein
VLVNEALDEIYSANAWIWAIIGIQLMVGLAFAGLRSVISPTNKDQGQFRAATAVGAVLLLGGLAFGLSLLGSSKCFVKCAPGLDLIALGFFVISSVVGMLFALTKYAEGSAPASSNDTGPFQPLPNTNLQKVSDWLTTLITGVTLSQIVLVPRYIRTFAEFLQSNMGVGNQSQLFAAGMVLYFPALGFVFGYFAQRLVYNNALAVADRGLSEDQRREILGAFGDKQKFLDIPLNPTPEQLAAAKKAVEVPLSRLETAADKASWARAQSILKNWNEAILGFQQAVVLQPTDVPLLEDYANALYSAKKDSADVVAVLARAESLIHGDPDTLARVLANMAAAYLYAPGGYVGALAAINRVLDSSGLPKRALDYFYRACANGQKWRDVPQDQAEVRGSLHDAIMADTRTSLNLQPAMLPWFVMVSDPNDKSPDRDPDDTDLVAFAAAYEDYRLLIGMH